MRARRSTFAGSVSLIVLAGVVTLPSTPVDAQTRCLNKCGRYVCIGPSYDWDSCMANGVTLGCSDAANRKFCSKFKRAKTGSGSRALK